MQQQITRGDYLEDLITIYIENNLQQDLDDLYSMFVFQCGEIQKQLTPAPVIKISFTEQESQLLTNYNTCYLAGITKDGHKETFNGSISFNTRGEVVYYEPTPNSSLQASTTSTIACPCTGISGVFANCTQPAIKAYFSINYVPTKLSELTNDTDFQDGVDVANSIATHNASTSAHPYIQSVLADTTEALTVSIQAETTARIEAVSLAISTTEAYTDSVVTQATEATKAYADSIVSTATTATEAYTDSVLQSATTAINTTIGDLSSLDTSVKSSVTNAINAEVSARQSADNNLQGQIDGLAAASDVTDIVGTYAELQAYDTQHLNDNDIIKVLSDSTHDDEPSYYRYDKETDTFSYIGSESAAYTKAQSNSIFVAQTTTVNNKPLSSDITLTYSDVNALSDTYATTIANNTSAIAANTTAIASNTSVITQHTTAIASNTSDISTINGKIPTDASSSNKLVSAASLAASIADFANKDLNNLSTTGTQKLRSLNAYANEGELLTDADGLAFIKNYAHSTFDKSKFTKVGSPIVTSDGIVSGLANNANYIRTAYTMDCSTANSWSWKVRNFEVTSLATAQRFFALSSGNTFVYINTDGKIRVFVTNSTTGDIANDKYANYTTQVGEILDVELRFTGTAYEVWINGSKTYSVESTVKINRQGNVYVYSGGTGYAPCLGEHDLKQFSITVDGVEVFSGNKTGIDTIKPDDYTVVGTPTISADGVASGFSSSNYLTIPSFDVTKPFQIDAKINITNFSVEPTIFNASVGYSYNSRFGLFFLVNSSGKLTFNTSSNGTSWDGGVQGTTILSLNTWYYTRLVYNGTTFTSYLSTDGKIYNQEGTATRSPVYSGVRLYKIGISGNANQELTGSIDLNSFKIYVDGDLVYQPCLKIPYTEAGNGKGYNASTGSKVVNAIYRDRVNDMAEQFGYANYYTLQEDIKTNYTVVGSPTISNDFVASGFSTTSKIQIFDSNFVSGSNNVAVVGHFKSAATQTSAARIIDYNNNGFRLILDTTQKLEWAVLANGSQKFTARVIDNIIQNNTDYYYQFAFENGTYKFYLGTSESNLTLLDSYEATAIGTGAWGLVLGSTVGTSVDRHFNGSMDLTKFKIYVDNKLAYEAVSDPNFTLPQVELYGLIGQRTLRDSYRNGINYWELYSNRDLEQGGSCTSGVEVTFARPFADTNYVLSVPYSAKSTTAFTPTQTGDWIAKGKGVL